MFAPRQLPNKLTKVSLEDLWNAVLLGYEKTGRKVSRFSVEAVMAQIEGECASRKAIHNFNFGNYRTTPLYCSHWQFFACGENVTSGTLDSLQKIKPGCITVQGSYVTGGVRFYNLWIVPYPGWSANVSTVIPEDSHPATKFAAFESIDEGIQRKWHWLISHPKVLDALDSGSIEQFNHALRVAKYYTAKEETYLSMLRSQIASVRRLTKEFDWGDVA